jgi:hypothetical protein
MTMAVLTPLLTTRHGDHMVGSMSKRIAVGLVALASAVGMVGGAAPARAASQNPVQVQLNTPGAPAGCPGGTFLNFEPDPNSAPSFLLVDPGPVPCPAGIALVQNPGGSPGPAVSLPLQASSCSTGATLFTQVANLLGAPPGVPGVAPSPVNIDPTGVCPGADAAFAALQGALAGVPAIPGSAGFIAQLLRGQEVVVAFLEGDPDQPIVIGTVNFPGLAASPAGAFILKEVVVAFLEGDPDQPIVTGSSKAQFFVLVPSATPGVSFTVCRFC